MNLVLLLNHSLKFTAFIVSGGYSVGQSVVALKSDGSNLCTLPDLPSFRQDHTMNGDIVCGGYGSSQSGVENTCLQLKDGVWQLYQNLLQQRKYHVSWKRPDGKLQLMGGSISPMTSEVVSAEESVKGFNMKYKTECVSV